MLRCYIWATTSRVTCSFPKKNGEVGGGGHRGGMRGRPRTTGVRHTAHPALPGKVAMGFFLHLLPRRPGSFSQEHYQKKITQGVGSVTQGVNRQSVSCRIGLEL